MPAVRTARGAAVALTIVLLLLRIPELTVVIAATGRSYRIGGGAKAQRFRILSFLHGSVLEGRLGKALLIAVCPLRATLLTFDGGGIDEAVALSPFWSAAMILVVADILNVEVVNVA